MSKACYWWTYTDISQCNCSSRDSKFLCWCFVC